MDHSDSIQRTQGTGFRVCVFSFFFFIFGKVTDFLFPPVEPPVDSTAGSLTKAPAEYVNIHVTSNHGSMP
jgi:hypothetical protein